MSGNDMIDRLEEWRHGAGRGRAAHISIDNGYGATCWEVELSDWIEKRKVIAAECFFVSGDDRNSKRVEQDVDGWHEVVCAVCDDDMDEWPGLGPVIELALAEWERSYGSE